MAISNKGFSTIKTFEVLQRKLELGLVKSEVVSIADGEDDYGYFITFQFRQLSTNKCTTSKTLMEKTSYADDPRGYYEVRQDYWRIYPLWDGTPNGAFETMLADIGAQMPEFKLACESVGIAEALDALEGKKLNVFYVRNKKGNLQIAFSERQYNYLIKKGYAGGVKAVVEDVLNEDAPW